MAEPRVLAPQQPPLSLYVHIPWCVHKCPYCDFNSHALKQAIPEQAYVDALLRDLEEDLRAYQPLADGRSISTIFIGGGTPSLFSAEAIASLLEGIRERIPVDPDAEITMEANPGTVEAERFRAYREGGITRISIGVQSLQQDKLIRLGRIHGPDEAKRAARMAAEAGLATFNLDLMHGLPQQRVEDALADLDSAISLGAPHISWYQLTIEPNTQFFSRPPTLPDDELLWQIYQQGHRLLEQHGYRQYEVSAYAREGHQCRHNLNYWRFGDYLGIGCGAHGKLTLANGRIVRTVKVKHPRGYLDSAREFLDSEQQVSAQELPFEYFMNRLRLFEPVPKAEFERFTGLPVSTVTAQLATAADKGWLTDSGEHWQLTRQGMLFLNELLMAFVED